MKHSFFRMILCLTAAAASMLLAGIRTGEAMLCSRGASAEDTAGRTIRALAERDYPELCRLARLSVTPEGQGIWQSVRIAGIRVTGKDVRDDRACYALEIEVADEGDSAFSRGLQPRWLWMVKDRDGWYAAGLMSGGPPDAAWWAGRGPLTAWPSGAG